MTETSEESVPFAKSKLGVTVTVIFPDPDSGELVTVTFLTEETEVPEILALILAEPAICGVNIVAAIPLSSVIAVGGLKFPEFDGDTLKLTVTFGKGAEPDLTTASTIAVVLVWIDVGLTKTKIVFSD